LAMLLLLVVITDEALSGRRQHGSSVALVIRVDVAVAIISKKALKKRTPCSDSLEQSGSTPREVSSREQCITTLSLPPHQAVVRLIIAAMAIIRCALLKIEQGVCGGLITIFNQPRLHSKSPNSSLGLKWSCL